MKKELTRQSFLSNLKSYSVITVALFLMAFGWTGFLIPNKMLGGGVSGIATLVYWTTGLSTGVTILVLNGILLLIALRILGLSFGVKTIYSIIMSSVFFSLLQNFISEPLVSDKFLSAIIGGGMSGLSIGIAFTQGGSTGGTDIIAMIINKYRNITQGRIVFAVDLIVISASYFIVRNLESLIYSYVILGICSYCIDLVLTGNKQSVQVFIFSSKAEIIADRIGNELGRGVTYIKGTGWYSKCEEDILMVVLRKTQSNQLFDIVRKEDPKAFVTMNSVVGVYGTGFEVMRK